MMLLTRFRRTSTRDSGYILLTLLLMVSLLAITAAIVTPMISFRIRRDNEEELIHRGVQYSRAVRKYFKKFGRYPTRIEDLENTNNMRFLRKRYKDPITGQDFKLLHFGEVRTNFGPGIAGATPAALAAMGGAAMAGVNAQNMATVAAATAVMANGPAGLPVTAQTSPGDGSSPSDASNGMSSPASGPLASGSPSGKVFGGGPIVGVASISEKETIRVFNKKNHYKDWQFIYDPASDRGGLLNTPAQPPLKGAVGNVQPGVGAPGVGTPVQGISGTQGLQPQTPPQPPAPSQPTQDQ